MLLDGSYRGLVCDCWFAESCLELIHPGTAMENFVRTYS